MKRAKQVRRAVVLMRCRVAVLRSAAVFAKCLGVPVGAVLEKSGIPKSLCSAEKSAVFAFESGSLVRFGDGSHEALFPFVKVGGKLQICRLGSGKPDDQ